MTENLASSRGRVADVARRALSGGFDGQPQRVPECLVTAVTDGRGDRDEVARATRAAFAAAATLELVLFDTDQIAGYVFESSRPPVIAGASWILKDLNRQIGDKYQRNVIYSGGGEGILLVPAGEGSGVCADIQAMYEQQTEGALGVTTEYLPISPVELLDGGGEAEPVDGVQLVSGTPAVLARVHDRIRRKKAERMPPLTAVQGGETRCISCRDRAGSVTAADLRKDLPGKICRACFRRWRRGKSLIAGVSLEEMVSEFARGGEDSRAKESYVGFVYADGNAMGALFGRLRSLTELRFSSLAVAHVFEQMRVCVEAELTELAPGDGPEEPALLSFLGGGDEAIWILPAVVAVPVAEKLAGWVEAEAAKVEGLAELLERAGLRKLTVGTGLVLCEHKYPVRYQFELARQLQKNAKRLFYEAPLERAPSSLDFEVLTDASPAGDNLEAARVLAYDTEDPNFSRTCRPYTAEALGELLDRVRAAGRSRLGNAQLFALQTGAAEGRRLFLNYLLYQIARNKERYQPWLKAMQVDLHQPGALENFFIHQPEKGPQATWIPDALQLAPFLTTKEARS